MTSELQAALDKLSPEEREKWLTEFYQVNSRALESALRSYQVATDVLKKFVPPTKGWAILNEYKMPIIASVVGAGVLIFLKNKR